MTALIENGMQDKTELPDQTRVLQAATRRREKTAVASLSRLKGWIDATNTCVRAA